MYRFAGAAANVCGSHVLNRNHHKRKIALLPRREETAFKRERNSSPHKMKKAMEMKICTQAERGHLFPSCAAYAISFDHLQVQFLPRYLIFLRLYTFIEHKYTQNQTLSLLRIH
jgi:hypothetical protein